MIDQALAQLLTQAAQLPQAQVRPTTETVRVSDGQQRVLYTLIDAPPTYNDDGADGVIVARYQLDYYAPQLSLARTLADRVRVALDGHRGSTESGARIIRISFPGDRFSAGARDPGSNSQPARFVQSMEVIYGEATPPAGGV
jgi:hypothetical protein